MAISVFIVDDHYMVIEGIQSLLQNEKNLVWMGHATNASSCLSFLKNQQPDIILMDVNLPDQSGIDLCKEVKRLYPSVFVLGLSTFNQQAVIKNMVENGASGYLLKNASKDEIMDAITAVLRGKTYFSFEAATSMKDKQQDAPLITRREKEVLVLIAEGLTNNEIADKLYISQTTVNTHRKSLLEKLGVKNTAQLIVKAMKYGFLQEEN